MGSRGKSDTINWAALSVMADAVSPVALYQSRPSPVAGKPGSEMARQAFMGSPSLNDDVSKTGHSDILWSLYSS